MCWCTRVIRRNRSICTWSPISFVTSMTPRYTSVRLIDLSRNCSTIGSTKSDMSAKGRFCCFLDPVMNRKGCCMTTNPMCVSMIRSCGSDWFVRGLMTAWLKPSIPWCKTVIRERLRMSGAFVWNCRMRIFTRFSVSSVCARLLDGMTCPRSRQSS